MSIGPFIMTVGHKLNIAQYIERVRQTVNITEINTLNEKFERVWPLKRKRCRDNRDA